MAKIGKISLRTVLSIVEWGILFLILFAFAIRLSAVQTYLAQKVTNFLSEEWNTTVAIDKVDIVFLDRVNLKNVLLLDQQKDTLGYIPSLLANVNGIQSFNSGTIQLDDVTLTEPVIKINQDDNGLNIDFIKDYFRRDKPSSNPVSLKLNTIVLKNARFAYNDFRKKPISTKGMDYMHLDLSNIDATILNASFLDGIITGEINTLQAKDKSEFYLKDFYAQTMVSPNGIHLQDMAIHTEQSDIYATNFRLNYSGYPDFREFVDSVTFNTTIDSSSVSMEDVAYFAPTLWGMEQMATFSGKITQKVKNLKVSDFNLKTGSQTHLAGTIHLPDFRNLKGAFYQERLQTAHIAMQDVEQIKLPDAVGGEKVVLDPYLQRLKFIHAKNVRLDGLYSQFVVSSNEVKTGIGTANIDNGILFTHNPKNHSFFFEKSGASSYDVKLTGFRLDKLLNDNMYGGVDGTFFASGEAFSLQNIHFNSIEGQLRRFDLNDYRYSNISIRDGKLVDKVLTAKMDVKDDNLKLEYNGEINFKNEPILHLSIDLQEAMLTKLGVPIADSAQLKTHIVVDLKGLNPNSTSGTVHINELHYSEGEKSIHIPEMTVEIDRSPSADNFSLRSNLLDANIEGKVNIYNFIESFEVQFAKVFPGLYSTENEFNKKNEDYFTYSVLSKDVSDLLKIISPELKIAYGTRLNGSYNGNEEEFSMELKTGEIVYQNRYFKDVQLQQSLLSDELIAKYSIQKFHINDSITLDSVTFNASGNGNAIHSILKWNPGTQNESDIRWTSKIDSRYHMNFDLEESYFSVNNKRWEILNNATIQLDTTDLFVDNFKLSRNEQFIEVNGHISDKDSEKLNFKVNEIDMDELAVLFGLPATLSGNLNGWGYISNPYKSLKYMGDLTLEEFYVNGEEVGDVFMMSEWNRIDSVLDLSGNLLYRETQTFDFEGTYNIFEKENNLDFNLLFDNTNIAFVNAFMDPKVVSDISGYVDGKMEVNGTPDRPEIKGAVDIKDASANVVMLGTSFTMDGEIYADKDGFYIDNMPIIDAEGNTGSLIGSIYHSDYADWNFDVSIDLEDDFTKADPDEPWKFMKLDKFLVLNTDYKEGELYYGKAYATGYIDIFGYAENLDITVDLKTAKDSWINFPMYGQADIEEGEDFIHFKAADSLLSTKEAQQKIDFTGVNLDLNFDLTPDVQMKIIFNEQIGDEITAVGNGDINIGMNNIGDVTMDGTYTVKEGKYNFAMGVVKQPFFIAEGGKITWNGSPYQANLDMATYYKVKTSLSELSPDQVASGNQEVFCFLNLQESLMKPSIGFQIEVPKASESGKALVNRINSDSDELNRQFFSLLLWKKFQPMKGSSRTSGGAALDLVSNQINSMLNQFSKDYTLNLDLNSGGLTGENEVALGVSRSFLDDRLVLTGSFGVEKENTSNENQSSIIGDLEVEYLLNENGTFRINVFNESNDNAALQEKNEGQFTQGIGVHYQEEFNTIQDFKAIQTFLDIFRKKKNKRYPIKRKKKQVMIPEE